MAIALVSPLNGAATITSHSVGGTAVEIAVANTVRKNITFQNQGGSTVYLGTTSSVTSSGSTVGFALLANAVFTLYGSQDSWWAITGGATDAVIVLEVI